MKIIPIKTKVFHLGNDLAEFVIQSLKSRQLKEGDVIAVTSKIVSLSENQIILKKMAPVKEDLIKREADVYFGKGAYECHLTIKHNILIPSAGIDESNTEDEYYILYPKDPYESAHRLWAQLRKHYKIKNLGVILTDSHTTPLRRGVTGISLSHCGFLGVRSLIGKKDIFGRKLKFTYLNHADAIAGMAVYFMGEADEKIPISIIQGLDLKFTSRNVKSDCLIPPEEDIYLPILQRKNHPLF